MEEEKKKGLVDEDQERQRLHGDLMRFGIPKKLHGKIITNYLADVRKQQGGA